MERVASIQKVMAGIFLMFFIFGCGTSKPVVKQEIPTLKPDVPFKVVVLSNRLDNTYRVGEDIHFYFTSNKDCYMTLINMRPDGKVRIILPNQSQKGNHAKAGFIYRIPSQRANFKFKAQGSGGVEIVRAIATLEDIPLFDTSCCINTYGSIQEIVMDRDMFEREMYRRLNYLGAGQWAEYRMALRIAN